MNTSDTSADKESVHGHVYDFAIIGGGVSGVLACLRICRIMDNPKIFLAERHPKLGGRLRNSDPDSMTWNCGLNAISGNLLNYWNQSLTEYKSNNDLYSLDLHLADRVGVLQGPKIREIPVRDAYGESGARALIGGIGVKDWDLIKELEDSLSQNSKNLVQNFGQIFKGNKRSPAAIVMDHLAKSWGIADLWGTQTDFLLHTAGESRTALYKGPWEQALQLSIEALKNPNLDLKLDCQIVNASYSEELDRWQLKSRWGFVQAKRLVIACSPWEALDFLGVKYWPGTLAVIAQRCKPTSLVTLCERVKSCAVDLPDMMLIPAEQVQVQIDKADIVYQATIDFEMTLQAPDAVKAIKRLKRARRKFHAQFPELECEGDHIALIPVGWAVGSSPHDRKLISRLDEQSFYTNSLFFCGDAYGSAANTDQNIISSIATMTEAIQNL